MNRYLEITVVGGLVGGLLVGEVAAAETLPHAEFVAVAPNPSPTLNIALPNVTAVTVSVSGDSFTPVEVRIPNDHLVVYPAGFVPPVDSKR